MNCYIYIYIKLTTTKKNILKSKVYNKFSFEVLSIVLFRLGYSIFKLKNELF